MARRPGAKVTRAPPPRLTLVPRPETVAAVPAMEKTQEKPDAPGATGRPGRLELAVTPWGEVVIDGKSRGVSPPLRLLEIPSGSHTIEIRNSTFPSHVEKINLKAGEAKKIQHKIGRAHV